MPLVRHRQGRGVDRHGGGGLTVPDEALRPAFEATVEIARLAASAHPPVPPPGPLRPLLKLRHLPDRALGTVRRVLDQDDRLRTAVAAATTEELVGTASWLYLRRPDGWEEALEAEVGAQLEAGTAAEQARAEATAARRLAAVEESLRKAEATAGSLRRDLAEVKERLVEERRARRAAETEAGRLRRQVEELSNAEPAPASADDRSALLEEVARLEAQLAATPPEPAAVDRAPVRRALDALDRVRFELGDWLTDDPEPRQERAEPPRRRPAPLPPAVFDDTVEAADHLVRLPGVVVLIDGYNVTKLRHPDLPLPEQRSWLLDAAAALAARCDAEVLIVFDGDGEAAVVPSTGARRATVTARYTQAGVEADDDLLALVATVPVHRHVVVVSDDRRVREGASFYGANLVGSGAFAELLRR